MRGKNVGALGVDPCLDPAEPFKTRVNPDTALYPQNPNRTVMSLHRA